MRVARSLSLAITLMVIPAACSSDSAPTATGSQTPTTTPSLTTASTTIAPSTSAEPLPTATTSAATTTTFPGEPFDLFVPQDGEMAAVEGVAHNDVLNIRQGPGVSYDIVGTLAPTADDVAGTGVGRLLESSVWWRVIAFGTEGWVNSSFVSRTGQVVDLTSQVKDTGGFFNAAGMEELGELVANALASVDPGSEIVMSIAPTVGDLGEVTYDVLGFGDDSLAGYRLHILGEVSGLGFSLKSVEGTLLCTRGISPDGLCS